MDGALGMYSSGKLELEATISPLSSGGGISSYAVGTKPLGTDDELPNCSILVRATATLPPSG
jgi:hypothetical protein